MSWFRKPPEPQQVIVQTVEVPVIGDAHLVNLYVVEVATGETVGRYSFDGRYGYTKQVPATEARRYLSCEQAHACHPGLAVEQSKAIWIGDAYFHAGPVLDVQPKPKVSKGRAKR